MVVSPFSVAKRDARDAAVEELLRTEATYVSDMKLLVDVFLIPLEGWAADIEVLRESDPGGSSSGLPHITQEDCKKIFANAKQLATFNRQLLFDLQKAHGGPGAYEPHNPHSPLLVPGLGKCSSSNGPWRSRRLAPRMETDFESGMGSSDRNVIAQAPALTLPGLNLADNLKIEDDPFAPVTTMVKANIDRGGSRSGDINVDLGGGAMVTVDAADRGPRRMLEVFLDSAPFLKMYAVYVNNFERGQEHLSRLERENPTVAAFLTACERQRQCRGLRLRDFLVQPVQRIPRYRLLLETILCQTPVESSLYTKVQESLDTMSTIASKISTALSLHQQREKVYELQHDFGGVEFVSSSRLFVKEGGLTKVGRGNRQRLHFVLFSDVLVYGQLKRKDFVRGNTRTRQLYHFRRELNLHKCFIVDAPPYATAYSSFWGDTGMMIVSEEKALVLLANTRAEKDHWLQAIRLCMRDLMLKTETREKLCAGQGYGGDIVRSPVSSLGRSHRWSETAQGSVAPLVNSIPRSVWVPCRDDSNGSKLVNFVLPAWAGLRRSWGCLSYSEISWGKDTRGRELAAAGAMSLSPKNPDIELVESMGSKHAPSEMGISESETHPPRQVSILVSMAPSEQLGLRLRDVHPGCGGGVVVVGFERGSPAKRAGVQQGDRITRVDGVAAFKGADVAWAISQQYIESGMDNGRTVHLAIKRGFAKTEEPWLPPMQSPADPLASPASSMVESLNSDDDIPEVMSAPGSRTFSGDGAAGRRRALGETNAKDRKVPIKTVAAATAAAALAAAVGAASASNLNGRSANYEKGRGGNSADSSAGRARHIGAGPAPRQANVNAGGAPAKPLSTALPSAITACWTCQIDDPFQSTAENRSARRRTEGSFRSRQILPVAAVCGGGAEEEEDDGSSDSSSGSSLFLTAVSPSRVPPPLVSMASTLPPPPVSMTSSIAESFSNFSPGRTWYSPSASQAETPDNSMSWLKPLPPPPPRKSTDTSHTSTHSPPPPMRYGTGRSYSRRWAQTPPPLGEPKVGPPFEIKAEERAGF